MPVFVLRLPKIKTGRLTRPRQCPSCGSPILQRWGREKRSVSDIRQRVTEVQRYRCSSCNHTFREYPRGVDQSAQTRRIRNLAALTWMLGLSSRDVAGFFTRKGIPLSHMTVWRDGQKLLSRMKSNGDSDFLKKYALDTDFLKGVSSKLGIVVVVDFGDGENEILGTVNEFNPRRFKAWLELLIKDVEIEVLHLGTGELSLGG
jgi:transposase-like protein